MIIDKKIAKQTAKYLLQINAIKLNPENPFTWASGNHQFIVIIELHYLIQKLEVFE